eukprot:13424396-Alexandrium_andersonii.AAC.1
MCIRDSPSCVPASSFFPRPVATKCHFLCQQRLVGLLAPEEQRIARIADWRIADWGVTSSRFRDLGPPEAPL